MLEGCLMPAAILRLPLKVTSRKHWRVPVGIRRAKPFTIMKTITTAFAMAFLALTVGVSPASAKGKGAPPPKGAPAKKDAKKASADAYLKEHDKDKNGTIEPGEFQGSKDEFTKWDKNADGHLDHSELTAMLKKGTP